MKQTLHYCAALLLLSASSLTIAATDSKNNNASFHDPRVPNQLIPASAKSIDKSMHYNFIDKASIKLHPYNPNIRIYAQYTNYEPALQQQNIDGELVLYHSTVTEKYVNCDKKLWVPKSINTYDGYFGEGKLQTTDIEIQRWQQVDDAKDQNILLAVCSLPTNE